MTRTLAPLRARPTARRPFSAVVVCRNDTRRHAFEGVLEGIGAQHVTSLEQGCDAFGRTTLTSSTDLCLLDGSTADTPLLVLARQFQAKGWRRVTLVSTRHDMAGVRAAILAGVRNYIVAEGTWGRPRSAPSQARALTDREVEVLQAVASGMSNKEIGVYLGLSSLTVKSHLARISRKLGSGDRAKLVAIGMRAGVID